MIYRGGKMNTDDNMFLAEQQKAVERMMEMSRRSGSLSHHRMPPAPSFVKRPEEGINENQPNKETKQPEKSQTSQPQKERKSGGVPFLGNMQIPFLSSLKGDKDMTLVLGLILILMSESSDRLLLLALLYILM